MKPEWCPQDVWEKARRLHIELIKTLAYAHPSEDEIIARALLEAEQRGRRMGMEEAAKVAEYAGNTWSGTRDHMQACQEAAVDDKCVEIASDIRAKMEESRRAEALNSTRS